MHNDSGTPPLSASGARVRIYAYDSLVTTLTAPASGTGDYWRVCDLDGATGGVVSCPNTIGASTPAFADGRPLDAAAAQKRNPVTNAPAAKAHR